MFAGLTRRHTEPSNSATAIPAHTLNSAHTECGLKRKVGGCGGAKVSHPELVFITFPALAGTKRNRLERVTRSNESRVKGGVIRQDDSEKLIQAIIKEINKVAAPLPPPLSGCLAPPLITAQTNLICDKERDDSVSRAGEPPSTAYDINKM